jgi:succinoglycan biosynthesis transport protein ExoP
MKLLLLTLVLVFDFALAGCHWGLYSATAQIQILPRAVLNISDPGDDGVNFDSKQFADEIEILDSKEVLTPIIRKLNLDQIWAQRFKSDHPVWTNQETLDHLDKVLKFEGVPQTTIIKITASSEVPQEAADIANAIADHYKAMRDEEETQRYERGENALRDQITQQKKVVDEAQAATEGHNAVEMKRRLIQQQSLLNALNVRFKQVQADWKLEESPVRILTRAVAPPE